MFKSIKQLLADGSREDISSAMKLTLENSDEAPFWAEKTLPYANAILSVLIPLRDQNLLFTPEGKPEQLLTPELLIQWGDLLSLKTLAFTLQKSNTNGRLMRTRYNDDQASAYQIINLEEIGSYLSSYTVNLENESEDFPIAHYNLHIGITDVIKKLL